MTEERKRENISSSTKEKSSVEEKMLQHFGLQREYQLLINRTLVTKNHITLNERSISMYTKKQIEKYQD
jgi:hypothetical protein